jgi:uncharacterized damage-inducible protein DinB
MNIVEEAITQWERFRAGVIAELELIPEDDWGFRAAEGARTVRALARHVVEAGVAFTDQLLREDGNFLRLFDPKTREELRTRLPQLESKSDIVAALKSTGADNMKRLRENLQMLETQPIASGPSQQSRVTAMHFAASHEMYHRGQIAALVRQLGHKPALTMQIEKATAAASSASQGSPSRPGNP